MSIPMTPAQAAQNANRDQGGRYATKTHDEADVQLTAPSALSPRAPHSVDDEDRASILEGFKSSYLQDMEMNMQEESENEDSSMFEDMTDEERETLLTETELFMDEDEEAELEIVVDEFIDANSGEVYERGSIEEHERAGYDKIGHDLYMEAAGHGAGFEDASTGDARVSEHLATKARETFGNSGGGGLHAYIDVTGRVSSEFLRRHREERRRNDSIYASNPHLNNPEPQGAAEVENGTGEIAAAMDAAGVRTEVVYGEQSVQGPAPQHATDRRTRQASHPFSVHFHRTDASGRPRHLAVPFTVGPSGDPNITGEQVLAEYTRDLDATAGKDVYDYAQDRGYQSDFQDVSSDNQYAQAHFDYNTERAVAAKMQDFFADDPQTLTRISQLAQED